MINWWERGEDVWERGDFGADPDSADYGGSDLVKDAPSILQMQQTPLGEPEIDFEVKAVYDSRFINSFDFNLSQALEAICGQDPTLWSFQFTVPQGYRMIPKKFSISFEPVYPGGSASSTASILQQGVGLTNNTNIIIGLGDDIDTFFICEEQTTFGINGQNSNAQFPLTTVCRVHGQLFPVTDVALPFTASNKKAAT